MTIAEVSTVLFFFFFFLQDCTFPLACIKMSPLTCFDQWHMGEEMCVIFVWKHLIASVQLSNTFSPCHNNGRVPVTEPLSAWVFATGYCREEPLNNLKHMLYVWAINHRFRPLYWVALIGAKLSLPWLIQYAMIEIVLDPYLGGLSLFPSHQPIN